MDTQPWNAGSAPSPPLPVPAPNYDKTVPPDPEEVELLFKVSPPHLKRVIIPGGFPGLRVGGSELLALKWKNVDLSRGVVLVDTSKKNRQSPWREVPIHQELLKLFREWLEEDASQGIEHVVSYEGEPVTSIRRSWTTALKNAGIERRIRPYDLRHACASRLIARGTDVGTVAKLPGHSSPQMVYQHYQHISTDQKRAAVETLPTLSTLHDKSANMPLISQDKG